MIIDFKFASLVISRESFLSFIVAPFISDMAYTRRTLQLEERIYAVQNYYLMKKIHELLVASQQFSRRSPIKRDLPPASKHNRKVCSKMITSIIWYHTAIYYIMSITSDRFRPYWVSSGGCKKSMFIIECFLHPPDETQLDRNRSLVIDMM